MTIHNGGLHVRLPDGSTDDFVNEVDVERGEVRSYRRQVQDGYLVIVREAHSMSGEPPKSAVSKTEVGIYAPRGWLRVISSDPRLE